MRNVILLVLLACGCDRSPQLVHGPYTGATTRFYVDQLHLPMQRTDFAADLDGDKRVDNQLAQLYETLLGNGLSNVRVAEVVAARGVDATVELVSDDPALANDTTVGVRWNGAADAPGDQLGGTLHDGPLMTNHIAAAHAVVALPLLDNANPSRLDLDHVELQLSPDGQGGFDGALRGVIPGDTIVGVLYPALIRSLAVHVDNRTVLRLFDADADGAVTLAEVENSGLVKNLTAPDARIDGEREFSLAIGVHLSRCSDDACTRPLPAPSCFDRVRNGGEVDVDCGGACGPCWPGDACAADDDCQTKHCDAGRCRAASCSDGVRDGYESDVDCGYGCGSVCASGQRCDESSDCAGGSMCVDSACG